MKSVASTPRVQSAIRKADALPIIIPGGKMRKGNVQLPGGDTYDGYFKNSDSANVVTIAAGKVVIGGTVIDITETEFTISAAAYIFAAVTYSSGYQAELLQSASYPTSEAGTWRKLVATVSFSGGIAKSVRNQCGPIHYEG